MILIPNPQLEKLFSGAQHFENHCYIEHIKISSVKRTTCIPEALWAFSPGSLILNWKNYKVHTLCNKLETKEM
jgi:hypothetical protein